MKVKDLPTTTPLINGHHDILEKFSKIISIKNKKVLCIGYDEHQLNEYILKYDPKEVVLLTLWDYHQDSNIKDYNVVIGDISKRTVYFADMMQINTRRRHK